MSELRLLGLTTVDAVVAYLPRFIAEHNARFALAARDADVAWRSTPRHLERVLACRYPRTVARDNTVTVPGRWIQLPARAHGRSWHGCTVEFRERLDGSALVLYRGEVIARQVPHSHPFTLVDRKANHARKRCPGNFSQVPSPPAAPPPQPVPRNRRGQITNRRTPAPQHPWRRGLPLQPPAPA